MPQDSSSPVIGLRITFCHERTGCRTLYFGKSNPAQGPDFRLLFLVSGEIEVRMEGRCWMASKGCCLLWAPGASMMLKAMPGSDLSYYTLGFLPHLDEGRPVSVEDIGLKPYWRLPDARRCTALLKEINRVFNGKETYRLTESAILGLRFLLSLKPDPSAFRVFPDLPDSRDPDERMEDAVAYIHRNYKKRIPVKALADIVAMQQIKFISAFKKATGLTPHQYLLRLKIEKAKDFLCYFRESPVITALELGFHDYAHFSRVFRRNTGMNPRDYRNKFKAR